MTFLNSHIQTFIVNIAQARNLVIMAAPTTKPPPHPTTKPPSHPTTKPPPHPTTKPPPPTTQPPTQPPTTLMNPAELLRRLITRADQLISETKTALEQYRLDRNYFAGSLEKELTSLIKYTEHLKKESDDVDSSNPFFREFVYHAEMQVGKTMGRIHELLYLGEKGTDPEYVQLLHLMDALKTRAYADIGYLFMHGKSDQAQSIKDEILQIEQLERELKSTDFKLSPQISEQIVEKILEHERRLEEELYKIEEDNL